MEQGVALIVQLWDVFLPRRFERTKWIDADFGTPPTCTPVWRECFTATAFRCTVRDTSPTRNRG
jgi:hypothetical protein